MYVETLFIWEEVSGQKVQTEKSKFIKSLKSKKKFFSRRSFHLSRSVYPKIQAENLQQRYCDRNDSSIPQAAHSMCALAFIPPGDVPSVFNIFHNEIPEYFITIASYFEINYVRCIRAIGRRKAVEVRYEPTL